MNKNIKLYRNHTPECKAQLAQTYRKLPTDAKRKKAIVNYLGCECPLWYRCAGEPHGKTTGTRDEQEAKNFVQGLDLGQGNADKTVTGELLKDCITKFTDERAGQLAKGTKEAYDDLLAQLQAYATLKGKAYIRDLDVDFFLRTWARAARFFETARFTFAPRCARRAFFDPAT